MDKKRPVSRQKKVGTGSVGINKRSTRETSSFSSSSSGRSVMRGKSRISIIVIGVIAFFLLSKLGILDQLPSNEENQFLNLQGTTGQGANYDQGAYEVNREVAKEARDKRTTIIGEGKDQVTVMLYLLGTDLESRNGMATMDLQEILDAELASNVNIVVETGGTTKWKNQTISNKTNERYLIDQNGMQRIEDNLGKKSMVDPDTLSDFIHYSKENYPADRYFLILWDHGGGSVAGYGYDEYDKGEHMTLDEIAKALNTANCQFDFIGFDACLMATLETALVLEPYADYMIASEEVEPGIGWYYTGWLNELGKNTSIATIDLGKKLIDDYIKEVKVRTPKAQATLSLVDLAELNASMSHEFSAFAKSTSDLIEQEEYKKVADSRSATKEFSPQSKLNQIDLIDFAKRLNTAESKEFANSLESAIKYNRMSTNITNANGLSIFFPFGKVKDVSKMVETYEEIGMDESYTKAITSFANLNLGGQVVSQSGGVFESLLGSVQGQTSSNQGSSSDMISGMLESFLEQGDISSVLGEVLGGKEVPEWVDAEQLEKTTQYYQENRIDTASFIISEAEGEKVLRLSEKEWELIHHIELCVFVEDGEGFLDLGSDNVFEFNDTGDLLLSYDGTWLTLDGQLVSYHLVSYDAYGDNYTFIGRIPAELNGERVELVLSFDQENPYGVVMGARKIYDEQSETQNLAKGLIEIQKGDQIDFLCSYYSKQGEIQEAYYLGPSYTFDGEWTIENLKIENTNYVTSYKLTDIYGNDFWTPAIGE
ncbi:MAG: peptidase C11 [Vallitaleaceae bacterium]|nr:peptidase C11 [Vallitaleaceae bacterium]